jgi:ketosteroid isomerase-like protein
MSRENVAVARRGLTHLLETGEVLWDLLAVDVEIYDHDTPDQGGYQGHQGFEQWLADWGAAWAGWSLDVHEFIDAGERVVALVRMTATGRGSGVEVNRADAIIYTVRDGRIVRIDYYNDPDEALKAVGLAG